MIVPALVAAGLLAIAGAMKLFDPTMTVGALRQMGLPSGPSLVRIGSTAELVLGVTAASFDSAALWTLVALSYAAFAAFVVAALVSGRPIGSCGCFGRADTPPRWWHVGADVALAAVAVLAASR